MVGHSSAKTFILETNVILHDPSCIHQFQDNDIVIPLVVIEEIDRFKRGSQVINLNAREFARTLDSLTGNSIFNGGVSLGPGKGVVRVVIAKGLNAEIREVFNEDNPDNRILSIAYDLQQKAGRRKGAVLVTKDVNMRMKAKALGIRSEDYTTDRIRNVDTLYSGKEVVEDVDDGFINALYQAPFELPGEAIARKHSLDLIPNKFFIEPLRACLL